MGRHLLDIESILNSIQLVLEFEDMGATGEVLPTAACSELVPPLQTHRIDVSFDFRSICFQLHEIGLICL